MFRGFHEGMGAGGWVLMSLFWVGLLAVIVWAIARIVPSRSDHAREPSTPQMSGGRTQMSRLRSSTAGWLAARSTSRPTTQLRSKLTSRPGGGSGVITMRTKRLAIIAAAVAAVAAVGAVVALAAGGGARGARAGG